LREKEKNANGKGLNSRRGYVAIYHCILVGSVSDQNLIGPGFNSHWQYEYGSGHHEVYKINI
jgi:hypothetical protein